MTVIEARKVLGGNAEKYNDDQILKMIDLFYALSNLIIDSYIEIKNK